MKVNNPLDKRLILLLFDCIWIWSCLHSTHDWNRPEFLTLAAVLTRPCLCKASSSVEILIKVYILANWKPFSFCQWFACAVTTLQNWWSPSLRCISQEWHKKCCTAFKIFSYLLRAVKVKDKFLIEEEALTSMVSLLLNLQEQSPDMITVNDFAIHAVALKNTSACYLLQLQAGESHTFRLSYFPYQWMKKWRYQSRYSLLICQVLSSLRVTPLGRARCEWLSRPSGASRLPPWNWCERGTIKKRRNTWPTEAL